MVRLLLKPPAYPGQRTVGVLLLILYDKEKVFANHLQLPHCSYFCVEKKKLYVFSFKATTVVDNNYTNNGIGASIPLPTTDGVKCDYHIPVLYGK